MPRSSHNSRKNYTNRQLSSTSYGEEVYQSAKLENDSGVKFVALLGSGSYISVMSPDFFKKNVVIACYLDDNF